jgi:hypothetical protein
VSDTQIIKQRIKVKFANPPTSKSSSSSTSSSSSPPSSSEVAPPVRHVVQNKPDIDSSFTASTTSTPAHSTEAKQRTIQEASKSSSPALVEELQDKLRKVTAEKDKLAKDLEALLSQNRRLLTAQEVCPHSPVFKSSTVLFVPHVARFCFCLASSHSSLLPASHGRVVSSTLSSLFLL